MLTVAYIYFIQTSVFPECQTPRYSILSGKSHNHYMLVRERSSLVTLKYQLKWVWKRLLIGAQFEMSFPFLKGHCSKTLRNWKTNSQFVIRSGLRIAMIPKHGTRLVQNEYETRVVRGDYLFWAKLNRLLSWVDCQTKS